MGQLEIVRLIQWLREHGHTPEEIVDCIEYMDSGRKSDDCDNTASG